MAKKPFVTVLLPVFNAENYLHDAITSILRQTYRNFELILLNDGSTDQSLSIINQVTDNRIKLINSASNKGLIYQLNLGIEQAAGEYIVRMDADDIAHSKRLEKQVAYMQRHPEVGLCGSYTKIISTSGKKLKNWKMPVRHDNIKAGLLEGAVLCHPTVMFRSKLLTQHNIKYSSDWLHTEDFELWTRLIHKTQFHVIPRFLHYYRQHENQISIEYLNRQQKLINKLIEQQLTAIEYQNIPDYQHILYFIRGKWELIDISKLIQSWNTFIYIAQTRGYTLKALHKLFSKRLFYYVASKKNISKSIKFKILSKAFNALKYWNLKQLILFLNK